MSLAAASNSERAAHFASSNCLFRFRWRNLQCQRIAQSACRFEELQVFHVTLHALENAFFQKASKLRSKPQEHFDSRHIPSFKQFAELIYILPGV
ncbi:hypothetical protein [Sphingomonas psychrotolerans]|uniref:Uncharacterized protein n=1 Tax=Sphingomonas psychrotolerans TaxID=1327635 RepID=A0A2K8MDB3_9SPHN|nr:hypothetical protein [Sphingomonas psychrotolerans]ATY30934.1 hypothetical protein CVN68_02135 [Sphingomonas psychrotolerans]